MEYYRKSLRHKLSPFKISLQRSPTGPVGVPFDLNTGLYDPIWFTGTANAIGYLNRERKLTVFPRSEGVRPCFMAMTRASNERGLWFSDPEGGRVGFVNEDGEFRSEFELGVASAPRALTANLSNILVATKLGRLIELPTRKERVVKQKAIDAVGFGPVDTIWYSADGDLYCIDPYSSEGGEFRFELPESRDIRELYISEGNWNYWLCYCDEKRDIVGFITTGNSPTEIRVIEFDLPPGTGPRAVFEEDRILWFTGRDGKSLFRIDYEKNLTEYQCSDASADLTRLKRNFNEMWFTEPRHSSISVANIPVY